MTSPKAATTTRDGRTYQIELADRTLSLPSVTTVLQNMAKPGLVWWSAGEVATYVLSEPAATQWLVEKALDVEDRHPVSEVAKPCKACGTMTDRLIADKDWWMHHACESAWKHLRKQPFIKRDKKANLGTHVHSIIERIILGDEVQPDDYPEISGHVLTFLRFVAKHQPTFELSEATVFNEEIGYAGTLDAVMTVGGKRWLVDVKTGGAYPEAALQMAAYRRAPSIYLAPQVVEPMVEVDDCAVLVIGESFFRFVPATDLHRDGAGDLAFETFKHLLALLEWKQGEIDHRGVA